jgi:hypothetical protein
MLLALLLAGAGSDRAEAAGVQPVQATESVSPDGCPNWYYGGVTPVSCYQGPQCTSVWGYGCNVTPCYYFGCTTGCGINCFYNCAYGCGNVCGYGCGYNNCAYGGCGYNVCGYGCGAPCNNACGHSCGGYVPAYYAYGYGYGFHNYQRCHAPAYSVRFENPPTALAAGTTYNIIAAVYDAYGRYAYNGLDVKFTTSLGTITPVVDLIGGRATAALSLQPGRCGLAQVTAVAGGASASTIIQVVC